MPNLILIKHAHSQVTPSAPPNTWPLSEIGRQRCPLLAEKLMPYAPQVIISSLEPKAVQTGQLIANHLHLPFESKANLHEHERSQAPFFESSEAFYAAIAKFFAHPQSLVYGSETADEAHNRFTTAIHTLLAQYPTQTVVIIAHGTVISLFLSRLLELEPFPLWQKLDLPSFVVLSLPEFRWVEGVFSVVSS